MLSILRGDRPYRDATTDCATTAEVIQRHFDYVIGLVQEAEQRIDFTSVGTILELQIPFPLFRAPAKAGTPHRHLGAIRGGIPHEKLPLAVLLARVLRQPSGTEQLSRAIDSVLASNDLDQVGRVCVLLGVIDEVRGLSLVMELAQQHVIDGHPPGAVLARVDGDPFIRVLRHHVKVGREDPELRPVVPSFREEVAIGSSRHPDIGSHRDQHLRVIPVGTFRDIGLLSPRLGGRGREIAVPVIERQRNAANELHQPGTGGITHHRHGRNGRKARNAIRPMLLDRIDHRCGDDLDGSRPIDAAQPPLATCSLPAFASFGVLDETLPGIDRVGVIGTGLLPQIQQRSPNVGILHTQWAVEIPTERDASLATTRFIRRQSRFEPGIVQPLHLPGDDAVLDVNVPSASTRAIHAMRAAHDFVVLPAVPVELFPLTAAWIDFIAHPGNGVPKQTHDGPLVSVA